MAKRNSRRSDPALSQDLSAALDELRGEQLLQKLRQALSRPELKPSILAGLEGLAGLVRMV